MKSEIKCEINKRLQLSERSGPLLTAIIQSSSVMTSIALAMCVTGLISLDQGIFLTIGWLLIVLSGNSYSFGVMFDKMFPGASRGALENRQ